MPSTEPMLIESLAYGGDGVGHIEGRVVFVPETVPGDTVRVEIRHDKGTFLRGVVTELVAPSPDRIEPVCPLAGSCGGCQWQTVAYEAQLRWKHRIVAETLRRIGGIDIPDVDPCIPASTSGEAGNGYRSVVRLPARRTKSGLIMGFHAPRSNYIVDVPRCPVATPRVNAILAGIRRLLDTGFPAMDVREVTIQASERVESALVTIVTGKTADLTPFADSLRGDIPTIAGVIHRGANGRRLRVHGSQYRYEIAAGRRFRIDERSFFQAYVAQAERMAEIAGELLAADDGDVVVDGYGGVGLFSLTVSPATARVHLYDLSRTAVKDSVVNAREAGFSRFEALCADTVDAAEAVGSATKIITDPPRTGMGGEAVRALAGLGAETIIYVSCNPATLARDLGVFAENGYRAARIIPVDMFPQTYHIETVVKLEK